MATFDRDKDANRHRHRQTDRQTDKQKRCYTGYPFITTADLFLIHERPQDFGTLLP